jgi:hypothetical protein
MNLSINITVVIVNCSECEKQSYLLSGKIFKIQQKIARSSNWNTPNLTPQFKQKIIFEKKIC